MASITERVRRYAERHLSETRLQHVRGVVAVARDLARRFHLDEERITLAAWGHDIDRELPASRVYALIADWGLSVTAGERNEPKLVHGKVSAARLARRFGVTDREVLAAVRSHTLGAPGLGPIGLALYVADFCEPHRVHVSDRVRSEILGRRALPEMVLEIISISERYFGDAAPETEALRQQLMEEKRDG